MASLLRFSNDGFSLAFADRMFLLRQGDILWEATSRQTWAATAYLRMILLGLVDMRFDCEGIQL